MFLDNKADANRHRWKERLSRLNNKHGRPNLADLQEELKLKTEIFNKMRNSFSKLKKYAWAPVICDSDIEEYDKLLSSDDDDDSSEQQRRRKICL